MGEGGGGGEDRSRSSADLRPRGFGQASDPVPRVLDRAGGPPATTVPCQETPCRYGGGRAPLTLNLLPPKSARGLPNLARIPRAQTHRVGGFLGLVLDRAQNPRIYASARISPADPRNAAPLRLLRAPAYLVSHKFAFVRLCPCADVRSAR